MSTGSPQSASFLITRGLFYGIAFTLYCFCVRPLYLQLQDPDKGRHTRFTFAFISLLLVCATGILALNVRMIEMLAMDHLDFPGAPLEYETSDDASTLKRYDAVTGILDFTLEVLTMAIQIWRLWIVWSGTRYAVVVIILPLTLLLSYIALDIPVDIIVCFVSLDQLGISSDSLKAMDTAAYATGSALTIIVTGLVAMRLLLVRRSYVRLTGTSSPSGPYLSIVAMLVESYVLESAWSIAAAISFSLSAPSYFILGTNDSIIKVIAYYLVVYRVATGQGWTTQTQGKLTTIRWNHHAQAETGESSTIRSV